MFSAVFDTKREEVYQEAAAMGAGGCPLGRVCLPMLTDKDHVTGTCFLLIIIKVIPQSVSKRRFAPSLSGQGLNSRLESKKERERGCTRRPRRWAQEAAHLGASSGRDSLC